MHPDQLDGELMLAPGFSTPPNMDYQVFLYLVNVVLSKTMNLKNDSFTGLSQLHFKQPSR